MIFEENKSSSNRSTVVVDSGSSYILMPRTHFNTFLREIQNSANIECYVDFYNTVYCRYNPEEFVLLPELNFTVDGKVYRVPRESLYVPLEEYPGWMAVEVTYIKGWNEWLFGLTFLENYYTVYDMDK